MSFTIENEKSTIHFHLLKPHQTNIFINKSINPCLLEPPNICEEMGENIQKTKSLQIKE